MAIKCKDCGCYKKGRHKVWCESQEIIVTGKKTLEDIDNEDNCGFAISHVRRDTLRKEARKWVNDKSINTLWDWRQAFNEFLNLNDVPHEDSQ